MNQVKLAVSHRRYSINLKDKILKVYGASAISSTSSNTNRNEALSALETLGFVRKQAEKACDAVLKEQPQASVEEIIKQALKNL